MEELKKYEEKMNKTLVVLEEEFGAIRAGRANPHVLDKIKVDYYGTPTPLQQVGNISVPEARMIVIQPWEKSLIKPIEKAILTSELGINPNNDGNAIRLIFPELTEDRRKELAKDVKKKGDQAKVAIRNIRRDAMDAFKKMEKSGDMSEDDPNSGIPRTEGYCRALGEQGIPVDPTLIVCGGYRLERGYEDMKRLLGERRDFTAVFAVSDDVAIGAMRAVQEAGLRVPEDLSIVGFDGIEMAEYTFPGLTTVSQPFEKIGEEASRLLVSRMKDGKRGGNLVLPFALQERESVLGLAGETLP